MAGNWRRLALAAIAAAVLVPGATLTVESQAAKAVAKKEAAAKPDDGDGDAAKAAAKKKPDPAAAQQTIESAKKLIATGKAEQAAQSLTALLARGGLPPPIMAQAFLERGIAYRKSNKPAQAISDLTSALWLKGGLSSAERTEALDQRTAAYQEAGLSPTGEARAATASSTDHHPTGSTWSGTTTTASVRADPAVEHTSAPATQSGPWDFFNNLFGGSASANAPQQPTTGSLPKPERPAAQTPAEPHKALSSWVQNTEVHAKAEPRAAHAAPPAAPARAKPEGKFRIQLATVRTEQEAKALAAKVKREHATALASREPEIDRAVVGNMGAFYRVRVGPFATQQESQAMCAQLKGSGLDCLTVTQ
jgi:cell division septation protein DedD